MQASENLTIPNLEESSAMEQPKFLNRYKIGSADWRRKAKEHDRKTIIGAILLGQDYESLLAESEARGATFARSP